jgi:predicted GH43/DUF377 family glycosyl hydrolase
MHSRIGTAMGLAALIVGVASFAADPATTGPAAWQLGPFTRPAGRPVISPDRSVRFDCPMRQKPVAWESTHTFNPSAAVCDGKICLLYRAEDDSGANSIGMHTSRLGLARSDDGIHFERLATPVLYPDNDDQKANEWDGGCEDPRLIAVGDGRFVVTYTQWNHKSTHLAVATSTDLVHWKKHGPMFAGTKYANLSCKSGAIVGKVVDGQLVATKINGSYWMYWGEGDIHLATSDDLIHWKPRESADGKLFVALNHRKGKFDSALAEAGPPAVLTERGIVVLYNGKNGGKDGDQTLGAGAYSGGQALFDGADPTKLLERSETPFFKPELPIEKSGQYAAGTTFIEGLVRFKGEWFLYYGCADSYVGMAVWKP